MKHCTDFEELIVESLYDEIDDARRALLDEHLAECDTCPRLLEEMRSTLDVVSQRTRRDPGADYWEGYWDRLVARMDNEAVSDDLDNVAAEIADVIKIFVAESLGPGTDPFSENWLNIPSVGDTKKLPL